MSAWGHRSSPPQWKYVESLSGIQLDYGFDSWNRLTGMVWSKGGATLDGQQRSLDLGNRVIARQRAMDATGEAFSHDGHHRMTAWWQGVPGALSWTGASDPATWTEVERYTLDAVLARQQTERQSFGGSPVATACAQNAAHFTTQVGEESRTVHEGFLNGDGTFYYRWDAWGRLTEVREAATGLVRRAHLYDAEGRRVLETETENGASKTTRHVYWGYGLAASYDLAGGNTRTYGFVGGADGEAFVRVQQGAADDLFELARDFQGSVLALIQRTTPTSVSVAERYRYEPFGKVAIEDGSGQPLAASAFGNERFFLGRIWDAEIGIYDVRARWYEPDLGAFLSPDPLRAFDSWNLYQYGLAEPNSVCDSQGLQVNDETLWHKADAQQTPEPVEPPPHPFDEGSDWASTSPTPPSDPRWREMWLFAGALSQADSPACPVADAVAIVCVACISLWIITHPQPEVPRFDDMQDRESRKSDKEKANDPPSWIDKDKPAPGEKPKDFAERKMREKYGPNWRETVGDGPGSEYNKIKKWGERSGGNR